MQWDLFKEYNDAHLKRIETIRFWPIVEICVILNTTRAHRHKIWKKILKNIAVQFSMRPKSKTTEKTMGT